MPTSSKNHFCYVSDDGVAKVTNKSLKKKLKQPQNTKVTLIFVMVQKYHLIAMIEEKNL